MRIRYSAIMYVYLAECALTLPGFHVQKTEDYQDLQEKWNCKRKQNRVFAVEKPQPVRFFTFLSTRLAVQSLLLVIKYAYGSCPRYKDAMLVIFSYIYTHLAPGPLRGAKNRQASSGPSHTQAKTTPRTVDRVFICIPPLLIIHTRTWYLFTFTHSPPSFRPVTTTSC